ncbi:MAG: fumarate hydratase [Clostridiales bacterium]|nr:fumarate hydratase [Clostridiales bacterium]
MLRNIKCADITNAVAALCIESNCGVRPDIKDALLRAKELETGIGAEVLDILLKNAEIAECSGTPVCQDTGMTVVFMEIGQDAHITGGSLEDAVNEGVRKGYADGFLRKSIVIDPINRVNTGDNTPAVLHVKINSGDKIKITVAPKGFGSENMSRLSMLTPSAGIDGVMNFIVETVKIAGPNPCPPVIVGVGVGGTLEKCALIAKEALLRPLGVKNRDSFWAKAEQDALKAINALDIGPAGFGGATTALAAHINVWPTHIAGLPVCVNIGCHVTRHAEATL